MTETNEDEDLVAASSGERGEGRSFRPPAAWAALVAAVGLVGVRVGGKLLTHADDLGRAVVKSSDELGGVAGRQSDELGGLARQADELAAPRPSLLHIEDLATHLAEEGLGELASTALDGWLDDDAARASDAEASPAGADSLDDDPVGATRTLDASIEEVDLHERYVLRELELPDGVIEFKLVERKATLRLRHLAPDGSDFDATRVDEDLPNPETDGFARFRLSRWGDVVRCVRQTGHRLPSGRINFLECVGDLEFVDEATWVQVARAETAVKLRFTESGAAAFAAGLADSYRRTAEGKLGPQSNVRTEFTTPPTYEVEVGPNGLEFVSLEGWRLELSGTY